MTKAGKHQEVVSALGTSDPVRRLVLGSLHHGTTATVQCMSSIEEDYSCNASPAVKQVC